MIIMFDEVLGRTRESEVHQAMHIILQVIVITVERGGREEGMICK